jgi:hypothetical protein
MPVSLVDIGSVSCEPVSGLVNKIYYALRSDFATVNDPKRICGTVAQEAATFAELAEIATAHIFKTGKRFFGIDFVTETGTIKSTQIGEVGRGLFQNELIIEIAGSGSDVLGFCRWIKNQQLVILTEEFGTGNVRQLGSARLSATVKVEHNIEPTLEGKNAATITFTDKNFGPSPVYKGAIQLIAQV